MKTSHYETSIKRWLSICTIQFFVFIKCVKALSVLKLKPEIIVYIIDTHLSSSSDWKISFPPFSQSRLKILMSQHSKQIFLNFLRSSRVFPKKKFFPRPIRCYFKRQIRGAVKKLRCFHVYLHKVQSRRIQFSCFYAFLQVMIPDQSSTEE